MAPNGTGIDNPSEWRGGGDACWRVEMLAKDEQIRVLTERLAAAEARREFDDKLLNDLIGMSLKYRNERDILRQQRDTEKTRAELLQNECQASAHVIIVSGTCPGITSLCRCDECRMIAIKMDDAGYMDCCGLHNRWWDETSDMQIRNRNLIGSWPIKCCSCDTQTTVQECAFHTQLCNCQTGEPCKHGVCVECQHGEDDWKRD